MSFEHEVWICSSGSARLVVRCASVLTWQEVRQFAAKKFGTDPAGVDARPANLEGEAEPTVEVRYVGNDYASGGGTDRRRLQERAVGAGGWVDA